MAPTIASAEAVGRIVPARWFHRPSSTSAVANCVPVLKLFIRVTVVPTLRRNIADKMERSGLSPALASRIALTTKKAASVGTMRLTTKSVTKADRLVSMPFIQLEFTLAAVPVGRLVLMPKDENHPINGVRVRKTAPQSIHFPNPPPAPMLPSPSRLRLIPARISDTTAAVG